MKIWRYSVPVFVQHLRTVTDGASFLSAVEYGTWVRVPHLAHIALLVRDYDEALAFYTGKLGFTLVEDTPVPEQDKRWVIIRAPENATTILLARAATPAQAAFVGNQAAGRVFLFLATDDFDHDFAAYTAAGVVFVRPPADMPYGKVAVFEDLYGNRWDLIEHKVG